MGIEPDEALRKDDTTSMLVSAGLEALVKGVSPRPMSLISVTIIKLSI